MEMSKETAVVEQLCKNFVATYFPSHVVKSDFFLLKLANASTNAIFSYAFAYDPKSVSFLCGHFSCTVFLIFFYEFICR